MKYNIVIRTLLTSKKSDEANMSQHCFGRVLTVFIIQIKKHFV